MRADSPVWHPFAQMAEHEAFPPLLIVGGEGGWLCDAEGRRYLDGNASIWTNVHGHNDPDLNAALARQLERTAHSTLLGLKHPPAEELAQRLVRIAPAGLERVFYSDNGAGAVEVALKQSFQYWQLRGQPQRRGVIGMQGGYHGDTFGAMAAGDSALFHGRFRSWCFPARHFAAPASGEAASSPPLSAEGQASASLSDLRQLLEREAAETACVILEPSVQGAAVMRLQPRGFLRAVADLCAEFDVHLICDEVFVAFGRLGVMTVCGAEGVTPDFLCLAKGLTAGYLPLAATLTRREIFDAFLGTYSSGKAFYHGHTFTGNPLACAVALENIRKLERLIAEGVLEQHAGVFAAALERRFLRHPHVRALRHRGFAAAIDLAPDAGSDEIFPPDERIGLKVCLRARDHGLLLRPLGDSLLLVPPLCLDEAELVELVDRTAAAIDDFFAA
ncbi:MAG TPA: adenosylmethionine--8-amino-7-oxononanoate transaminase [Opitutaceae bacterium]|jgi:adenosylmethionine-8-amino-7-oxononanoate aminotransferase|nr:adenosylmethionine--8-amino-7-oxononanoate transaminase [Opitutaceae bacterium]